jgi:hypothetical protein
MTAIYGVLIFQKQPYMVLKQNWRNYSFKTLSYWITDWLYKIRDVNWINIQERHNFILEFRKYSKLIYGLITGLIAGLSSGLFAELVDGRSKGLIVGLIVGLIGLSIDLMTDENDGEQIHNHIGTYPSAKNVLLILISAWLAFGLVCGLSSGLIVGLRYGWHKGLISGLDVLVGGGTISWLIVDTMGDGKAAVQYYVLRWLLIRRKYLPWRLVPFLNHCVDLIFLRRVGGGYIFVHRLLMEHFAEMYVETPK